MTRPPPPAGERTATRMRTNITTPFGRVAIRRYTHLGRVGWSWQWRHPADPPPMNVTCLIYRGGFDDMESAVKNALREMSVDPTTPHHSVSREAGDS